MQTVRDSLILLVLILVITSIRISPAPEVGSIQPEIQAAGLQSGGFGEGPAHAVPAVPSGVGVQMEFEELELLPLVETFHEACPDADRHDANAEPSNSRITIHLGSASKC